MTKESSFFVNFARLLNLFLKKLEMMSADAVIKRIDMLKRIHDNIKNMQKMISKKINVKRKMTL